MNANQIQVLRESYNKQATRPDGKAGTTGEYMRFITDCNLEFVTSKDMVVTDDNNGMVHCVCLNEDVQTQGTFPVKIISAPYEDIHAVEAIMSRENFEKFISDGFLSGISAERKDFMVKWFRDINMQRQQPSKATPYYEQKPTILNMVDKNMPREDGVINISSPATLNYDRQGVDLTEGDDISSNTENGVVNVDDNDNIIEPMIENDMIRVSDPNNNVQAQVVDDILKLTEI